MTFSIPEAWAFSQASLMIAFVVFLRIGAVMAVLPAFGEKSIPQRVRLALTICFTLVVAPAVAAKVFPVIEVQGILVRVLFTEVAAGLALGIVIRLFVIALEIAGSIIAQSTSLSQMFGGGAVDAQPVIGHLLLAGGLALAAMMDLHVRVTQVLIVSYDFFPVGVFIDASELSEWGVSHIKTAFSFAFSLAAPFVIASLVYNVALGVINRAMPQLMVSMVGAPAITLGSMVLMCIALPFLFELWRQGLGDLLNDPFKAQ
jgi:flagellar biosynthetic protein FliR